MSKPAQFADHERMFAYVDAIPEAELPSQNNSGLESETCAIHLIPDSYLNDTNIHFWIKRSKMHSFVKHLFAAWPIF